MRSHLTACKTKWPGAHSWEGAARAVGAACRYPGWPVEGVVHVLPKMFRARCMVHPVTVTQAQAGIAQAYVAQQYYLRRGYAALTAT